MKRDMMTEQYVEDAVELLRQLIAVPSVSRDEKGAADVMQRAMQDYGFKPFREGNNL